MPARMLCGLVLLIVCLAPVPAVDAAEDGEWVLTGRKTPAGSSWRRSDQQVQLDGNVAIHTKFRGGRVLQKNESGWRELPERLKPGGRLQIRVVPRMLIKQIDGLNGRPLNATLFTVKADGPGVQVEPGLRNAVMTQAPAHRRTLSVPVPAAAANGARFRVTVYPTGLVRGMPYVEYTYEFKAKQKDVKYVVDFIDANPLLYGGKLPQELSAQEIANSRHVRKGTTTDGASRLIVRVRKNRNVPVAVQVTRGGGTLSRLPSARYEADGVWHGFLLYTPRENFGGGTRADRPRAVFDPSAQPRKRLEGVLEVEDLVLHTQALERDEKGELRPIAKPRLIRALLARPPVVLVHGLFSDPLETWVQGRDSGQSFCALLERAGLMPFLVDYHLSNGGGDEERDSSFAANARVVWESPDALGPPGADAPGWFRNAREADGSWMGTGEDRPVSDLQRVAKVRIGGIRQALDYYRKELQLAATQADVVGHSMGGLLARVYAATPTYRRRANFDQGDIHRLVTICTPHFGSEVPELRDLVASARIDGESFTSWLQREIADWVVWYYAGDADSGALNDLRATSAADRGGSAALRRIPATPIPSFAIATRLEGHLLGHPVADPGDIYLHRFSAMAMMFFNNRPILDAFIRQRAEAWRKSGSLRRGTDRNGRAPDDPRASDWSDDRAVEYFTRLVNEALDENAYVWETRKTPRATSELRRLVRETPMVPFGWLEGGLGEGELAKSALDSVAGRDVPALKSEDLATLDSFRGTEAPPPEVVSIIRDLVFHNDANDGCVRVVSQLGGIEASARRIFSSDNQQSMGISHGGATWYYPVIRQTVDLLKWDDAKFSKAGFPAAGEAMPCYLPLTRWAGGRVRGDEAVRWSGYVASHAKAYGEYCDQENVVIIGRPVNRDSTPLLAQGAAAKGMPVKGKSSNWGPQRGFICLNQRFSKLWRTLEASPEERERQIAKYSKKAKENLSDTYPPDGGDPDLIGRTWAIKRALELPVDGAPVFSVMVDPQEEDAEQAVYLKHKESGDLYSWKNAKEKDGHKERDNFDARLPLNRIDPPPAAELVERLVPMDVLADGLSDKEVKPYLTADYDLLAIGYFNNGRFHGTPPDVSGAPFHPIRGKCSKRQIRLIEGLNTFVRERTGYPSGDLTHHGPENQYDASPYVDYPLLVFDPGVPGDGQADVFLIRQGPIGYRDLHLKRYFSEAFRRGYNLYPNPIAKGWLWKSGVQATGLRGYDPRDARDLQRPMVAEQPRPRASESGGSDTSLLSAYATPAGQDAATTSEATSERERWIEAAERIWSAVSTGAEVLGVLADIKDKATIGGALEVLASKGYLGKTLSALARNKGIVALIKMLDPSDLPRTLARWVAGGHHKQALKDMAREGLLGSVFEQIAAAGFIDAAIEILHGADHSTGRIYEALKETGAADAADALVAALQKLSREGDPSAMVDLGILWTANGKGRPADIAKAVIELKRAARVHGYPAAIAELGRHALHGWGMEKSHERARAWFERAAKEGDSKAINALGVMYERGMGVKRDVERAMKLYRKAVAKDLPMARQNLARLLGSREGTTEEDKHLAFDLALDAAKDDFQPSMHQVASWYLEGYGVEKDEGSARAWLEKAAKKSYPPSMLALARMHEQGIGGPKDPEQARVWYRRAEASGDSASLIAVALRYRDGREETRDPGRARALLEQAAANGSLEAASYLGKLYLNGQGVSTDEVVAGRYLRAPAEAGLRDAMTNLGTALYREGRRVGSKDMTQEAHGWYLKAALLGDRIAAYNASVLYRLGHGTDPNPVEAYAWALVADDAGVEEAEGAFERMDKIYSRKTIRQAHERADELQEQIDQHRPRALHKDRRGAGAPIPRTSRPPLESYRERVARHGERRILALEGEATFIVSLGSFPPRKLGETLSVSRGTRYIATIRIVEIEGELARAEYVAELSRARPRVGDDAR